MFNFVHLIQQPTIFQITVQEKSLVLYLGKYCKYYYWTGGGGGGWKINVTVKYAKLLLINYFLKLVSSQRYILNEQKQQINASEVNVCLL
jgi:hypothetical protein